MSFRCLPRPASFPAAVSFSVWDICFPSLYPFSRRVSCAPLLSVSIFRVLRPSVAGILLRCDCSVLLTLFVFIRFVIHSFGDVSGGFLSFPLFMCLFSFPYVCIVAIFCYFIPTFICLCLLPHSFLLLCWFS